MLPTKGYFQDIECPYYNSSCGRPYCHFRHRKKEEKELATVVPTYKPTPKSQLADIQSNRSHIPISYVPDLAFRPDKKLRPASKIENPTYKPTPLSILSSVKTNQSLNTENKEHIEVIKEIKQNIANVEYDPTVAIKPGDAINFDELTSEFDLITDIIEGGDKESPVKPDKSVETGLNELNTSKTERSSQDKNSINKQKSAENEKGGPNINTTDNNRKLNQGEAKKDVLCLLSSEKNVKTAVDNKESGNHKKHKKDKSRSSSEETHKSKEKHKHSEKHKNSEKDRDISKKDYKHSDKSDKSEDKSKKDKSKSKDSHSSSRHKHKDQEKSKSKSKEKSTSGSSKSKEEKRHLDSKHDRTNHRKNKEKEKNDNERSRSSSKDRKISKKEQSKNKEQNHSKDKQKKSSKTAKRSRSRSKERRNSKDEDKRRKHSSSKEKQIDRKDKSKHNAHEKEKYINSNNRNATDSNHIDLSDCSILGSDSDVDIDKNETLLECYKIFNEYKPENHLPEQEVPQKTKSSTNSETDNEYHGKKRIAHASFETLFGSSKATPIVAKPKTVQTPGQILTNRYKLAKQAQASREQELLINEVQQSVATKRPPPSLLEAARERKKMKEMEKPKPTNIIDDILKGSKTITYCTASPKLLPKKIAPVHNVLAITKAKEKIPFIKPAASIKTIAQTQKGNRVAHIPDVSLSDIPDVLQAETSKLPVNVRSRYLTMIADECVKMYISKEEAYSRALKEEYSCYEKCKVITTYRNSAMLAVNRLRKEIQERNKSGLGLYGVGEDSEGGSNKAKVGQFYSQIKKWVLTSEELDIHGYPRQTDEYGIAEVRNFKSNLPSNLDENQRICSRCKKLYQVDDDGWPLFEEECCYHPMKKRTIRGEQTYLCCRSSDETGCATSDTHVYDGFTSGRLEGFQTTLESEIDNDPRSQAVYALDCEMCYTTKGLELTRVTIVDIDCKTVYESLVKPLNPIIDYNTRFSGITKEQMDKTSTNILQVQANILHLCNSMTILVGHSLESDMKALKIVHGMVIDTSVLFPHKMGLPHKRALKVLASEHLRKIIQNDVSGHDSAEDAITCMELLKWKLKEESKIKH